MCTSCHEIVQKLKMYVFWRTNTSSGWVLKASKNFHWKIWILSFETPYRTSSYHSWMYFYTFEDIPEHIPVSNNFSKYGWYTYIRGTMTHKNTSYASFESAWHIEYILKLYQIIYLSSWNILSDFWEFFFFLDKNHVF